MGGWLHRLMAGRYGIDRMTGALLVLAFLFSLLRRLFRWRIFALLYWVALIFCVFRVFSRDIPARRKENEWLGRTLHVLRYRRADAGRSAPRKKPRTENRREYRYFSCPNCRQRLRVPRGRGRISITCPKCNHSFIKKS